MPGKKAGSQKRAGRTSEERIVHEFHIISEGLVSQIKQVAEGVANVDEKLDRTRQELKTEIEEKTLPIAQAVVSMNGRVGSLEGKVDNLDGKVSKLDEKVNQLDVKVDRIHQELRSEIQETRQEILAAVKFSYAELDKRLTTLEKEFLDLKHRVEKIENRSLS